MLDCITILIRMQGLEYICVEILQLSEFMHVSVISLEYRETWVIELSLEEIIRVDEMPRVIINYWSRLPLLVFEIEYASRFADLTGFPMHSTIHSYGSTLTGIFIGIYRKGGC